MFEGFSINSSPEHTLKNVRFVSRPWKPEVTLSPSGLLTCVHNHQLTSLPEGVGCMFKCTKCIYHRN